MSSSPTSKDLDLSNCSIPEINQSDLKKFRFLKHLWISNNKLTHLPGDLFVSSAQLMTADFSYNNVRIIKRTLVDYLRMAQFVDLRGNPCINVVYNDLIMAPLIKPFVSWTELKQKILEMDTMRELIRSMPNEILRMKRTMSPIRKRDEFEEKSHRYTTLRNMIESFPEVELLVKLKISVKIIH